MVPFDPPSELFPFTSRFVEIDGVRLHYVDEGPAGGRQPTLVMVHGNPAWSFLFRHLIHRLSAECRCIAVDLPGSGMSDLPPGGVALPNALATWLTGFLDRLGITDAILVAHDWGGPIGLAAALARPQRLTRFVLGNTWAWPVNGDFHFEWFSRAMGGMIGRFASRRWAFFVNVVIPGAMRRGKLAPEVMAAYRAPFQDRARREGLHVFPREIIGSREFLAGLAARLPGLEGTRFLFLWPDADIAFRAAELAHWRRIYPQAAVVEIPRCGHFLWEEAPEETGTAIRAWLVAQGLIEPADGEACAGADEAGRLG